MTSILANRWVTTLPRRWARNGAIYGLLLALARHSDSQSLIYMFEHPKIMIVFIVEIVLAALVFALIAFVLGRWARWGLSPVDEQNWSLTLKAIPRKWILGMLCVGSAVILLDLVFHWRGQMFAAGWDTESVVTNAAHIIGALLACVLVGSVAGYISRRGLKKAVADDELLGRPHNGPAAL